MKDRYERILAYKTAVLLSNSDLKKVVGGQHRTTYLTTKVTGSLSSIDAGIDGAWE